MTILLGDYPVVFLLVLFRVAALIFMLPFFGVMRGGRWILAGASFPLALLICGVLPPVFRESARALVMPGDVLWALLGEALLGAAMGAICGAFIGACTMAGALAARGTSLSMAQEMDPMTGESSDLLAQAWRMMFLVVLLALDVHLVLIQLVVHSFESVPVPWLGWMTCGLDLARLGGVTIQAGVSLAMPVLVVTTLVTIAMALMARFAQEFNVLFLSLPFRVISGLFILGLSIVLSGEILGSMAQEMLSIVARFLAS
ncbi:MAG: flagellar biosynthetic protein FliR [Lentisphaerae bacterium]|nr:flagellar biosynthetic protein FliR [Lentisphaerota bacterium]